MSVIAVYNSYLVSKSKDVRNLLLCWQLLIWSREANDTHKLDSVGPPAGESVTRHLSKGLRAAAFLSITIVLLAIRAYTFSEMTKGGQ
jgi:hypothetical protein